MCSCFYSSFFVAIVVYGPDARQFAPVFIKTFVSIGKKCLFSAYKTYYMYLVPQPI